jgi:uncharacterized DUF497 family protein
MIEFDPTKDKMNVLKHGISLRRARDLEVIVHFLDERFEDQRYRAYGSIDGRLFCLAYVIRNGLIRAISLRRSHEEELLQYVEKPQ